MCINQSVAVCYNGAAGARMSRAEEPGKGWNPFVGGKKTGASRAKRGVFGLLGNAALAFGIVVLIAAAVYYGYGIYKDIEFAKEAVEIQSQLVTQQASAADETGSALQLPSPPASLKRAEAVRDSLPPIRILIPNVGIDALVVETGIKDGEWQVPKFVVGHLQGTANPGEKGNMAMSGHVSSINAGNVFAKLDRVRIGDDIYVFTKAGQYLYRANDIKTVANDDVSVLDPTPEPTLTLITCTGTWNPIARDYTHRLIVKARIFQDTPPFYPGIRPM